MTPKILVFAGSLRTDSYNKKLAKAAAEFVRGAGAEATVVDLRDFKLPVYDGDEEVKQGLPEGAKRLKKIFLEHQGLLIASPEYNSSVSGALKNALDWVSRSESKDEPSLACFSKKTAALVSASPGALGGLRGLVHLRAILGNIGVLVLPGQVAVGKAHEAFDEKGALKDEKVASSVKKLMVDLVQILEKLNG